MSFLHRCHTKVSLAKYSTFGIGGEASYLFEARSIEDLQEAFLWLQEEELPWFVVGRGSNCLFPDEGFVGLIILNKIDSLSQEGCVWRVGAGYSFPALGKKSAQEGFSGLEFAAGIPGSLGGAIYMNAGAHGQSTSAVLESVNFMDDRGAVATFSKEELGFGYRTSLFQSKKGIITEATFTLSPEEGSSERQQAIIERRKATQPYREKSCGCVFRNPPGVSAGKLIEEAGLKGMRVGGAEVSTLHANFIINTGGATACDVLDLLKLVRQKVFAMSHVYLEHELCLVTGRRIEE